MQITGDAPTGGRQTVMNAKGLTFDDVRLDGQPGGAVALEDRLGGSDQCVGAARFPHATVIPLFAAEA